MPPSSLRSLFQTASAARHRCNATIDCYPRRLASSTTTIKGKKKKNNQFLTPGFQPTAITGDNIGFYSGSTFFEGVPPAPLPILNLAAVLSPGQFCKTSSWSTSHHRHKGTKSGVDAAQRLVQARRELIEVIRHELRIEMENNEPTRKIYAITGHGVPCGLLRHLAEAARSWLGMLYHPSTARKEENASTSQTNQQSSSAKVVFTNTPDSKLLDQNRIRTTSIHGTTNTLPSLPKEWEHDFEMYMVAMDRMGSRMVSLAVPFPSTSSDSDVNADTTMNDAMENFDAAQGTGSILTPSQLQQWDVTIMKGEALPMSLMPNDGRSKRGKHNGEGIMVHTPKLTLEWVRKENDCWNVILRLQDDGATENSHGGPRDPISLVFEGTYVAP